MNFIKLKPDATYNVVSLIHVIEHLPIEYTFELFREIFRVLIPGGSLILETPYTKNIVLGTYNFWLDPTHLRPVNVKFVKALGEYFGFVHFYYFPLQSIKASNLQSVRLLDAFRTTSPDVSMILVKESENKEITDRLVSILEKMKENATVDLEEILDLYDRMHQESSMKINELAGELAKQKEESIRLAEELAKRREESIRLAEELAKRREESIRLAEELAEQREKSIKLSEEFIKQRDELINLKVQFEAHKVVVDHISATANEAFARSTSIVTSQFWRSYDKLRKLRKYIIRKKREFTDKILKKKATSNIEKIDESLSLEETMVRRRLDFLRRLKK